MDTSVIGRLFGMTANALSKLHFGSPTAFHEIYNGTKRWDKDADLYGTPGFTSGSFVFLKYAQAKGMFIGSTFIKLLSSA